MLRGLRRLASLTSEWPFVTALTLRNQSSKSPMLGLVGPSAGSLGRAQLPITIPSCACAAQWGPLLKPFTSRPAPSILPDCSSSQRLHRSAARPAAVSTRAYKPAAAASLFEGKDVVVEGHVLKEKSRKDSWRSLELQVRCHKCFGWLEGWEWGMGCW